MTKTAFIINNQKISGSFWGMLIRECGSIYHAARAVYKARKHPNIQAYCKKGIKEGWINSTTREMDYNKKAMETYINVNRVGKVI